jgi:hypothetical protein
MVLPLPSLAGVPSGTSAVLDLTADLAPILSAMVVVLGLCVIGLAVVTALHDTWWEPRRVVRAKEPATPAPDLPRAA